ncbi:hypothetical protein BLL52_0174 [Rhodoferax antarcticus ANT.BR]|uniref:Uncharacterized protein n=1 Tax=Rhodoferax antarcticus ANT.BR TaxID=1111071 RepID=A0A1Q8YKU7_9BURK|nr:hypothetical protein BLL52_0174 [Rhodoferax antarcticus ANT.BR]
MLASRLERFDLGLQSTQGQGLNRLSPAEKFISNQPLALTPKAQVAL